MTTILVRNHILYGHLKKASKEATPGTTIYIRKGIYQEKLIVKHSGTKSKPILFKAYKQDEVILTGKRLKTTKSDPSLIVIDNKNHVTIDGLTMQDLTAASADETAMGVTVTGSSSHITLKNNHVKRIETLAEGGNAHGIAVYATGPMKDINILNNTVEDLKLGSSEALVLNGNINGFRIENNLVRRNDNIGIDLIGFEGTFKDEKADFVRHGVVKGNIVHDISSYGNPAYGKDYSAGGIYVDGGKNIIIANNTIYKCDIGIEATSEHEKKYADDIHIINNTIYDNTYTGISIGGYDENRGGTKNTMIARNIIYRNDTKGLEGGQILLQHDTQNNMIAKNILTAGPSRLFIANYFTTNQGNSLTGNVFHKEKAKTGIWIWKDKAYTSFMAFKRASRSDATSSYVDPRYRDAAKHDFSLKENSPAKRILE
ncbi:right-handed parallel beta-helix repeat-containing protein [Virgibacillus halophilus]|uniref:Right-handed parallel beta-helix repeat-containing protein n=1 Tax=Tigheibacillus halophilus TaxID=361280 RepID=A0ABU5C568_9BACI|nr:right-handed parallel beta-helix repeat-containing protein [Virgibacillus halophilus]